MLFDKSFLGVNLNARGKFGTAEQGYLLCTSTRVCHRITGHTPLQHTRSNVTCATLSTWFVPLTSLELHVAVVAPGYAVSIAACNSSAPVSRRSALVTTSRLAACSCISRLHIPAADPALGLNTGSRHRSPPARLNTIVAEHDLRLGDRCLPAFKMG